MKETNNAAPNIDQVPSHKHKSFRVPEDQNTKLLSTGSLPCDSDSNLNLSGSVEYSDFSSDQDHIKLPNYSDENIL